MCIRDRHNSNSKVPTQNAVKTYVDTEINAISQDKIIEGDTSVEAIDSGSDGNIQFKIDAALKLKVDNDGHTIPGADSASDLGLTGTRWRNVYADTLYGAGSNITSLNATQLASGTVPIARLGDSGTKSGTTFLAGDNTFKTVVVAINSVTNQGNNRVLTSSGTGTADASTKLTFDQESSTSNLAITGTMTCTGNITAFTSDIRLKTEIKPIENAVAKLLKLNGFTYEHNELAESLGYERNGERFSGVSAQDVKEVLPEAVKPAPANADYMTVQYEKLVPLLIEAIKELKAEIDELKK